MFDGANPASAMDLKTASRATSPACTSCANDASLRATFSNILDSASIIHAVSVPKTIRSVARSSRAGLRVQYVSSATGELSFLFPDMSLNGSPALGFDRIYRSGTDVDSGFGCGGTTTYDDPIQLSDGGAILKTESGDVVNFVPDSSGQIFKSVLGGHSTHKNLLAVVEVTLQNSLDNSDTVYDNCVILISQNCWSRCH